MEITQPLADIATASLVDRAYILKATIAAAEASLASIERELIARGSGRHQGSDEAQRITVVGASSGGVKFVFRYDAEDEIRKLASKGDPEGFYKLFDRKVTYSPCKGFADVVGKLLTPAAAKKVLALCTKTLTGMPAYCRYK